MNILSIILLAVLAIALVPVAMAMGKNLGRGVAYNVANTHGDGCLSLKAEEVIATRHLLVSRGSGANGVLMTDAGDLPLGVMDDEADSGDVTDGTPKNVQLLGAVRGTVLMVAAGVIPDDTDVYAVGAGKVDILADAAEGDYLVGRSVTAASAANQLIEVVPVLPVTTKPGA